MDHMVLIVKDGKVVGGVLIQYALAATLPTPQHC